MVTPVTVPSTPRPRTWRRGLVAVLAMLAVPPGLWLACADPGGSPGPGAVRTSPLVHWRDARHDWLLVADRTSHELVVYDARSGAPLRRLGAANGLGRVESIARTGDRLLVQRAGGSASLLTLPDLRRDGLAVR